MIQKMMIKERKGMQKMDQMETKIKIVNIIVIRVVC